MRLSDTGIARQLGKAVRLNSATLLALSLVLPAVHLLLTLAIRFGVIRAEGSWGWFLVFLVDFPASLLFLPFSRLDPLIVFGVGGTLWWLAINRLIVIAAQRLIHHKDG